METKFKSQVCTDRFQSERLLALGLKKETADMHHYRWSEGYWGVEACPPRGDSPSFIPSWSLYRLIKMMPENIFTGVRNQWHRVMYNGALTYEEGDETLVSFRGANIYDRCINCIEC